MASISASALGALLLLILLGLAIGRLMSRPVERGGAHRADGLTEADGLTNQLHEEQRPLLRAWAALDAAPVEVNRLADQPTEVRPALVQTEERTEVMPVEETPVEHHGADADWSPTEELALVPARSLDPWEALEAEIEAEVRADLARVLDPIQQQIARLGHAEQHTCEVSFEHLRAALDAQRAGAL